MLFVHIPPGQKFIPSYEGERYCSKALQEGLKVAVAGQLPVGWLIPVYVGPILHNAANDN